MRTVVIFTEERSAEVMLESMLPRLLPLGVAYRIVSFEGKQDLEKQVPIKLKGWRTPDTSFVVLRDQDSGDCRVIKENLRKICQAAQKPETLIRIACRELEGWYFGDLAAVGMALEMPGLENNQGKAKYRNPDSIHNPAAELEKITKGRYQKVAGSREIGKYLNLDNLRSTSFKVFVQGIKNIVADCEAGDINMIR